MIFKKKKYPKASLSSKPGQQITFWNGSNLLRFVMKKWDRPHISRAVWLVPGNVNLVQALQKNTDWLGIQLGSRREISFCIRYDRDYVAIILSLKILPD